MKVLKVTLMFVDHDGVGPEGAATVLENARYPNRCIMPRVLSVEEREIGEWHDEHPLNYLATRDQEFARLFAESPVSNLSVLAAAEAAPDLAAGLENSVLPVIQHYVRVLRGEEQDRTGRGLDRIVPDVLLQAAQKIQALSGSGQTEEE